MECLSLVFQCGLKLMVKTILSGTQPLSRPMVLTKFLLILADIRIQLASTMSISTMSATTVSLLLWVVLRPMYLSSSRRAKSAFRIATAKLVISILLFQVFHLQEVLRLFLYQLGQSPMVKMISSGTMQNVRLTAPIVSGYA